jgi:hypothetical protein
LLFIILSPVRPVCDLTITSIAAITSLSSLPVSGGIRHP